MADEDQKTADFLAKLPTFDTSDAETYNAFCHCGKTHWTVTLSPSLDRYPVGSCNCSICIKNGYLLAYPTREHVKIQTGEEDLKYYTFGKMLNFHKFCGLCGSSVFFDPKLKERGDFPNLIGINIRMFQDVKLEEVNLFTFDGYSQHPLVEDASHLKPIEGNTIKVGAASN